MLPAMAGHTYPTESLSEQEELASLLLGVMDDDLADGVSVLDLLDDLATAGLRLARDDSGAGSPAYFDALSGG